MYVHITVEELSDSKADLFNVVLFSVKKGNYLVCEQEHTLEGLLQFAASAHG